MCVREREREVGKRESIYVRVINEGIERACMADLKGRIKIQCGMKFGETVAQLC